MGDMAKVFWTGRSQAVRLPKEYRFDSSEVSIRREGKQIILEAANNLIDDNMAWAESLAGCFDADAAAAALDRPGPDSYGKADDISFD